MNAAAEDAAYRGAPLPREGHTVEKEEIALSVIIVSLGSSSSSSSSSDDGSDSDDANPLRGSSFEQERRRDENLFPTSAASAERPSSFKLKFSPNVADSVTGFEALPSFSGTMHSHVGFVQEENEGINSREKGNSKAKTIFRRRVGDNEFF